MSSATGSNSESNMNSIAEMIRADPSMRQSFIDIAAHSDPALGQQLAQSLRLLDAVGSQGQSAATLTREETGAVKRLMDLGFDKQKALAAYLASDKNVEHATNFLNNPENTRDAKATKPLAIGRLIGDNPALRQGLSKFIAEKNPVLAQQIKQNPALFEAALRSAGGSNSFVDDFNLAKDENAVLAHFYKNNPNYIRDLANNAPELANDAITPLGGPDLLPKLIKVSLYQQVIYCNDSSSMMIESRWAAQAKLVKKIARITTRLLPDGNGVALRFINRDVDSSQIFGIPAITNMMENTFWRGWEEPATGTYLRSKILEPLIYSQLQQRNLAKPYLIFVMTYAMPSQDRDKGFVAAIKECGVRLQQAGYPRGSVKFLVGQFGTGENTVRFLESLRKNPDIQDMVYATADQLDERLYAFNSDDDSDRWLLEMLYKATRK